VSADDAYVACTAIVAGFACCTILVLALLQALPWQRQEDAHAEEEPKR
jgi:hypothetical protein